MLETGGGAIHAEALAFALARHIPLTDAQEIVKSAALDLGGKTLAERVAAICRQRGLPEVDVGIADMTGSAMSMIERSLRRD